MLLDAALVAAGLGVLLFGAWLTVRSAVSLAASFGLSPVLIGATVVAFGTSAPEFVVSLLAASREADGLAVGNVLGSNVANVAFVLGASAIVAPMAVHWRLLRWEIPVLGAATAMVLLVAADGVVSQIEGAAMFSGLLAFIVISPRLFPERMENGAAEPGAATTTATSARLIEAGLLVVGLAALTGGAEMAVRGAVALAERVGMSDAAIGATVVATGTSLPEVATSVTAAFRREHEIAVANVVGSNIFNLLGVLGLTSALVGMEIDRDLYQFEMIALAVSTAVLLPLAWPRYRIGRIEGALLLGAYVAFLWIVFIRGT